MATELGKRGPDTQPPRWLRAAGIAIPLAAVGVLALLRPEIVRGTFSSAESVLRVALVVVACVLFSRLVRRVIPNVLVRSTVVAVPAAVLLWVNVAPYFEDDVKIRGSFPESFTTAGGAPAPGGSAGPAPTGAGAAVQTPSPPSSSPSPSPAPAGPVQLTSGRFRGLDGHRGSGEASIFRQPDGSHVIAFRELSVSSVPDPVLYLVPGTDRERPDGGTRLGRFDAGRDRYQVPAGVELEGPLTVLVWCQRFAVPVAGATQSPV